MDRWSIPAGQLEASYARAAVLQREIERKQRLLGRRIQVLAKGLAGLMQPGKSHHRRGIGIHAFPVDGVMCLAAGYLVDRLPKYLDDVTRDLGARIREADSAESTARQVGRQLSAQARRARTRR